MPYFPAVLQTKIDPVYMLKRKTQDPVMQPGCVCRFSPPGHMFEGVHDDGCKVLGELWSFPLAVLDDIVGQVDKGQLA